MSYPNKDQNKAVHIAFAADDNFIPSTAVAISSILRHASPEREYKFILIHDGLSDERIAGLLNILAGTETASIRFIDVRPYFAGRKFYTASRPDFSQAPYYRLCLPWVLSELDKVLYLDGDIIAMTDVAELFDTDVTGYMLAAVSDICGLGSMFLEGSKEPQYRKEVLGMSNPEWYFNSGVMVMNLESFRSGFSLEWFMDKSSSKDWIAHDQDVLNSACNDNVCWLPPQWNYIEKLWFEECLPTEYIEAYNQSRQSPKIVHFASILKPWKMPFMDYHGKFWEIAADTDFHLELLEKPKVESHIYVSPDNFIRDMEKSFYDGKVGFRCILKCIRGWFHFKLFRGKKNGNKR